MPASATHVTFQSYESCVSYYSFIYGTEAAVDYIEDFMKPTYCWPAYILNKIMNEMFNYSNRCILGSFFYQNGVSKDVALDFLTMYFQNFIPDSKKNKFLALWLYWDGDGDLHVGYERRSRYFAFDLNVGKILDLNGNNYNLGRALGYFNPITYNC